MMPGSPPPFAAHLPSSVVIALDVGGSSVKSGLLEGPGQLLGPVTHSPLNSAASVAVILGTLAGLIVRHQKTAGGRGMAGVAFGFPGPFDYAAGISRIHGVGKFEALYGLDVRAALRAALGRPDLPLRFRNDAEAAVLGEARHGAGRPYRRLIGLTLGTGCGSAFVADGRAVTSGPGVPAHGWLYPLPFAGQRADDVFSTRGLLSRLQRAGLAEAAVEVAAAWARQGHTAAREVFAAFGADLGAFLQPLVRDFGAEAVLILGGIGGAFDLFGPALAQALPVPAVPAQCGEHAALFGAADLFYATP